MGVYDDPGGGTFTMADAARLFGGRVHSNFQPAGPADIRAGQVQAAIAAAASCQPRGAAGGRAGCMYPRPVMWNEPRLGLAKFDGKRQAAFVACGRCRNCHERALRNETSIVMAERACSDWAVFLTLTYANGSDLAELQAEAEADGCDPLLSQDERFWRSQNRICRQERLTDDATARLKPVHVDVFLRRLRSAGQREGFSCTAWVVGQYGGETARAHFHLIVCGTGPLPKRFQLAPDYAGSGKQSFAHLAGWHHGHAEIDHNVSEKSVRYVLRYMMNGIGRPRGITSEQPAPRADSPVWNTRANRWEPRGTFRRPRKGGYEYARKWARHHAKHCLFPRDFRCPVPEMRDQRRKARFGAGYTPNAGGRSSRLAGPRLRVALEAWAEERGVDRLTIVDHVHMDVPFQRESVEKCVRFWEAQDRRRNRAAFSAEDVAAMTREIAARQAYISAALDRSRSAVEKRMEASVDDRAERMKHEAFIRSQGRKPAVYRVDAFLAEWCAKAQRGEIVFDGGYWIERSPPP